MKFILTLTLAFVFSINSFAGETDIWRRSALTYETLEKAIETRLHSGVKVRITEIKKWDISSISLTVLLNILAIGTAGPIDLRGVKMEIADGQDTHYVSCMMNVYHLEDSLSLLHCSSETVQMRDLSFSYKELNIHDKKVL